MNWIEICTSQTQGTCPSSLLFQTMCGDRARSVHCNSYIPLALKICLRILVKVRKVTTEVLKGECLGHFILIETVSFFIIIYHFQKKKLVYYIHFEIIIDPCNLISSPHYDVFSNHTIFCSVRLFSSFVHLTKYEMDSSKKSIQL